MASKDTYISASDLWELVNSNTIQANAGVDKGIIGSDGATDIIKSDNVKVTAAGLYTQRIVNGDAGNIIDESLQHKRIEERNGKEALNMFINKWIPLEEKYFSSFDIQNHCDFYFKAGD